MTVPYVDGAAWPLIQRAAILKASSLVRQDKMNHVTQLEGILTDKEKRYDKHSTSYNIPPRSPRQYSWV